jgi:hypothetical protein
MGQEVLCSPEDTKPPRPEGGCLYHRICGDMTPGETATRNQTCNTCLDALRYRDRSRQEGEKQETTEYLSEWYNERSE